MIHWPQPIVSMRNPFLFFSAITAGALVYAAGGTDWPHWRGPNDDGMAASDAPLHWSDTEHVAWKVTVPGKGNSSPVGSGDRIFLTTAVPTGKPAAAPEAAAGAPSGPPQGPPPEGPRRGPGGRSPGDGPPGGGPPGGRPPRRGGFGGGGPLVEQKFELLAYDRKTGK